MQKMFFQHVKPVVKRYSIAFGILLISLNFYCRPISSNEKPRDNMPRLAMDEYQLKDKIKGMLVGSAIGDAMGAPTEMWSRDRIQMEYGYVDTLTNMVREPSPEGTWDINLPAGATTDDTRWKLLLQNYFKSHSQHIEINQTDPFAFANYIQDRYKNELNKLKQVDGFEPQPYEDQSRKYAWLQEWAIVAKAFSEKDLEDYNEKLHRFYGGEMTCAGQLYTPMIGLFFPGQPKEAYEAAYKLSIFDIGYAKDISALTAAMVSAAMHPNAQPDSIINVIKEIDPRNYFKSRLVGRASHRIYLDALNMVYQAHKLKKEDVNPLNLKLPQNRRSILQLAQMEHIFNQLDAKNQDMPFHAGEIFLINLSALLFAEFDFQLSLEFVINYGRDNDTVGAITGAILGALHGFKALPQDLCTIAIKTNKEKLGIDLEEMADELSRKILEEKRVSLPLQ